MSKVDALRAMREAQYERDRHAAEHRRQREAMANTMANAMANAAAKARSTTYRYRDVEQRRIYMRELMRKRRAEARGEAAH
jgi:hypothetical protein